MKNKLRELRAAREWSQSDLADKLGVSRQTINAIETESPTQACLSHSKWRGFSNYPSKRFSNHELNYVWNTEYLAASQPSRPSRLPFLWRHGSFRSATRSIPQSSTVSSASLAIGLVLAGSACLGPLSIFHTPAARGSKQTRSPEAHGTSTQVRLYTVIMVGVGVGFFLWARHLGASSPVIFGTLLLIEGLGGMIVSLTEWWRFSHIGISSGLMAGGFLVPFVEQTSVAVPVGAAFLLGSLLSAGIL